MALQITFKNGEAKVQKKGATGSLKCWIKCESRKDATKIAKESKAHAEYIEYCSNQSPTMEQVASLSMSNAWKFWNAGIRTLQFWAYMIFGMSLQDSINLANFVYDGKTIEYMTINLPRELFQDIKQIESIAIKGRVC